jgi:hypothetical protein
MKASYHDAYWKRSFNTVQKTQVRYYAGKKDLHRGCMKLENLAIAYIGCEENTKKDLQTLH